MEWKEINEYPEYLISDEGKVWSKKSNKLLSLSSDKDGYQIATLYKNGNYKKMKVHRLVAQAFLKADIEGYQINHKDENPINNNVNNLELCDSSYNINYGNRNKKVSKKLQENPFIPKKAVEALDKSGNVVMKFDSLHDAERAGFNRSAISQICNGSTRLKTYKGFVWRFCL